MPESYLHLSEVMAPGPVENVSEGPLYRYESYEDRVEDEQRQCHPHKEHNHTSDHHHHLHALPHIHHGQHTASDQIHEAQPIVGSGHENE